MKKPYNPDMATLLREADPARRREYRRKARENMARPTPPGFFFERAAGGAEAQESEEPPESAPSLLAKDGESAEIDGAALPSAMRPAAPVELPVPREATVKVQRHWPARWKLVGGLTLVVVASLGIAVGVVVGQRKAPRGTDESAMAVRATVMEVPSVMGVPTDGPSATVAPSAAVVPAAAPSTSATVAPSAAVVPAVAPSTSATVNTMPSATLPPTKLHGKVSAASGEPDAGAVAPQATAEPPTPAGPPAKPPTEDKPVF